MRPFRFEYTPQVRPLIIRAGLFSLSDSRFETEYLLEDFHALHLYSYSATIRTADGDTVIAPGDVTITPAGEWTRYALPEPGTHLCVHFELPQGSGAWELPFHCPASRLSRSLTEAFAELVELWKGADIPENRTAAEEMLFLLLFRLYRSLERRVEPTPRSLQLAHYLDTHFEQKCDVAALAERFRVSQTHLTRNFKRDFGRTIGGYIMQKRIEKARYLLAVSRMSIKEIGMIVGYSSAQEFNKRFHQIAGMSPSACRARHRPHG